MNLKRTLLSTVISLASVLISGIAHAQPVPVVSTESKQAQAKAAEDHAMAAQQKAFEEKHPPQATAHEVVTPQYKAADAETKKDTDEKVEAQHQVKEAATAGTLTEAQKTGLGLGQTPKASAPAQPKPETKPETKPGHESTEGLKIDHPGPGDRNDGNVSDKVRNTG